MSKKYAALLLLLGLIIIFSSSVHASPTHPIYGLHFADGAEATIKNGKQMYTVEMIYTNQYNATNDVAKIQSLVNKGFTVILRIDFQPGQTVPALNEWVDRYYFAQACKQIVQDMGSLVNIYIIGNEMSSSHEGAIPASWYAKVFNAYDTNSVYDQMKLANSNAIITAGALSAWPGYEHESNSNITWFNTFLDEVEAVDAFALHAYSGWSHWDGTGDIEDPRFSDTTGFFSFREFMKKIYAKYGDNKPVYITETNTYWNLNSSAPTGYADQNYRTSWIKEVYQAVDEWNQANDLKVHALVYFTYSTLGITDPNSDIYRNALARTDNTRLNQARADYGWVTSNTNLLPGYPNTTLRFQAENYANSDNWNNTNGISGTDYYDTTTGNSGGAYRQDHVDILYTPDGNGFAVGWIANGEWLKYHTLAGGNNYKIKVRYSRHAAGNGSVRFEIDGSTKGGSISLPNRGDWDSYGDAYSTTFYLPDGFHEIKLVAESDHFNIDYFELVKQ